MRTQEIPVSIPTPFNSRAKIERRIFRDGHWVREQFVSLVDVLKRAEVKARFDSLFLNYVQDE